MTNEDKTYDFTGTPWLPIEMFTELEKKSPRLPFFGVGGQVVDLLFADGRRIANCFREGRNWAYMAWRGGHTVTVIPASDPIAFMLPPALPADQEEKAIKYGG